MKLEDQLGVIANKADLHRWIDELADDAVVLLLADSADSNEVLRYHAMGNPTVSKTLWMVKTYEHFLFREGKPV